MPLNSELFRGSKRLNDCLVLDSAHVVEGDSGDHVRLIQHALAWIGGKPISGREYLDGLYGRTTADSVLDFKTSRRIINYAYQSTPDNVVGKMTIAALDREVRQAEAQKLLATFVPGED